MTQPRSAVRGESNEPAPALNFPIGSLAARLARGEPVELVEPLDAVRPAPPPSNHGPEFFHAGDFPIESGEVIRDLTLCYETWGQPNQFASNGVLLCHGSGGDRLRLGAYIGPGKPFDPERHYIVALDAIGHGQSTSPSSSGLRMQFPHYNIRDMVRSACLLLTKGLGLTSLRCVAGNSMGGYQALEWAITYPAFVKRAISIIGGPRRAPQQTAITLAIQTALEADPRWQGGNYSEPPIEGLRTTGALWYPWLFGEEWYLQYDDEKVFHHVLEAFMDGATMADACDTIYQERACDDHDVAAPYNGDLAAALGRVRLPVLLMPCASDLIVPPRHSQLAHQLLPRSTYVEIPSYAGHGVTSREVPFISHHIQAFLESA